MLIKWRQERFGVPKSKATELAKSQPIPLLKKRTVTLDEHQIKFISDVGRANNREFSAQLRTIIDDAKRSAPRTAKSSDQ